MPAGPVQPAVGRFRSFRAAIGTVCDVTGWRPVLISDSRCCFCFVVSAGVFTDVHVSCYDGAIVSTCQSELVLPAQAGRDLPDEADGSNRWFFTREGETLILSARFQLPLDGFSEHEFVERMTKLVAACWSVNSCLAPKASGQNGAIVDNEFVRAALKGASHRLGAALAAALLALIGPS